MNEWHMIRLELQGVPDNNKNTDNICDVTCQIIIVRSNICQCSIAGATPKKIVVSKINTHQSSMNTNNFWYVQNSNYCFMILQHKNNPDSKVHVTNVVPTWVLSAPGEPMLAPWTLLSGNSYVQLNFEIVYRITHMQYIPQMMHAARFVVFCCSLVPVYLKHIITVTS